MHSTAWLLVASVTFGVVACSSGSPGSTDNPPDDPAASPQGTGGASGGGAGGDDGTGSTAVATSDAGTGDPGSSDVRTSPTGTSDAGTETTDGATSDGAAPGACAIDVTTAAVSLGKATVAGEYALTITASSKSKTSWAQTGNEGVVLEVLHAGARVGHIVLHQGQDSFAYGMHVGALAAGDELTVRVSPLTAPNATKGACISKVTLTSDLGAAAEGIVHAPIVKWPTEKAFDDLPVVLGWSKQKQGYQLFYTNENGGTTALCGGGARGVRSEMARWGRAFDIEGVWGYGGAGAFERCTGVVPAAPNAPRMDAQHPIIYYGNGHNTIYESRGGYAHDCGTGAANMPDAPDTPNGDLEGWNVDNPGNDLALDDPYTIVLRPLPVDMDAIDYDQYIGRREGVADTYAPWLYRITDSELQREGKIDNSQTFPMTRYLFVDVYADDVGGSGDATCGPLSIEPQITSVSGGFVLRAVSKDGTVSSAPQMTVDYFGTSGVGVKRLAIPLAAGVSAGDITKFVFDAYDDDGIYFLALGDAFVPQPASTNTATLDYVHKGKTPVNVYVDDDNSSCSNGVNTKNGVAYPCAGTSYTLAL